MDYQTYHNLNDIFDAIDNIDNQIGNLIRELRGQKQAQIAAKLDDAKNKLRVIDRIVYELIDDQCCDDCFEFMEKSKLVTGEEFCDDCIKENT